MKLGKLTFKGGVHPPHHKKYTENVALEFAKEPKVVKIPLHQHIGAPCEPLVKPGDEVKVGQKIGESSAFISAYVHSSVSGTVKKLEELETPNGKSLTVIIESDGKNEVHESVKPKGPLENLSPEEIVNIVKEAGVTGLGGASFPTHIKLVPPAHTNVDRIVLNGAECEPYLTADHRLMLETPEKVVLGLKAIMKAVGVTKGYIGIEDNKMDAVESMKEAVKNESGIEVMAVETKYPQGDQRRLVDAMFGIKIPPGARITEVGVVACNVGTAAAIADAITTGMPLIQRIVTITGSVIKEPKNLIVKLGTPFNEVVEQCGGYTEEPSKLIMGGPMMGMTQFTDEVPVIKGTSGILALNEKEAHVPDPQPCIRCGKCVDICPVYLQPLFISKLSLKRKYEEADKYNALSCIECGSCSYICPSKRPLLQAIRVAKREIVSSRKKR